MDTQQSVFDLVKLSFPQNTEENTLNNYKTLLYRILNLKTKFTQIEDNDIEREFNSIFNKVESNRFKECINKLQKSKIQNIPQIIHFIIRVHQLGQKQLNFSQVKPIFDDSKLSMDIENQLTTNRTFNKSDNSLQSSNVKQNIFELTEQNLLKDVLFCIQGIEGQYIQYDASQDSFCLRKDIPVKTSTRQLINIICECGWLFKKISMFCQIQQTSLIIQSLQSAIQRELSEYYRLIANLEGLLESQQLINLKRVHYYLQEPQNYLIYINQLISTIQTNIPQGTTSSLIINTLFQFSKHGSPQIALLFNRLQQASCQPLIKYINQWIFDGNLLDIANEFFIEKDEKHLNSKDQGELWKKLYKINYDKIPILISFDQAYKIYDTGRAVNWLRKQCDHKLWHLEQQELTIDMLQTKQFTQLIEQANQLTNNQLVNILLNRFQLMEYLITIKQFFLMGNGNFSQLLIEMMEKELQKNARLVYKHTLIGLLEMALKQCNFNSKIQSKLTIKLLEPDKTDSGWDIFCLDYEFTEPLNSLFDKKAMLNYYKIFNHLWRIRRVEQVLLQSWTIQQKNRITTNQNLDRVLKLSLQILNYMIHFIKNFYSYIMLEAIETPWKKFIDQVKSIKNLDHLIKIHDQMQQEILDRVFLNQVDILKILFKIFEVSFRYKQNLEHLFLFAREVSAEERSQKYNQSFDSLLNESTMKNDTKFKGIEIVKLLLQLKQMHSEQVLELIKIIQKEDKYKFLLFKLDFNEYYYYKSQEKIFQVGFDKFLEQCIPNQIKESFNSQKVIDINLSQPFIPHINSQKSLASIHQDRIQPPFSTQKSMSSIQQDYIQIKEGIKLLEEQKKQKEFLKAQQSKAMQIEYQKEIPKPQKPPLPQQNQFLSLSPINKQSTITSASQSNIFQPQPVQSLQQQFEQQLIQQQAINQKLQQIQTQQSQIIQSQQNYRQQQPNNFNTYQNQQNYLPNFGKSSIISHNQSQSQISIMVPFKNDLSISQDENLQQLMDKQFNVDDNSSDEDLL